ncbi:BglG family transcription antiterminator [Enterococcus raffinosus]|uniref:BglG family transcription antiterminator n=3 Tax=Enterococcus TaxID=1350 RepID=A0AAP5KGD3_9ENTE|nr:BglG family transcription antiterminator [Enterococcus raffinosus]MDT2524064.1 BglG family transcription antiterminator [Enterococcus raffinosus]MDT2530310.1 BglG family transcription antiterminator [Enterococcus raffinosus]MDT2534955.1 BglG family transcription antiterminator [Enterococcus raffinosus]MDT2546343.1 BglG family transcription antiterminator [Enterococcus raffinosus]MDT2554029.1 BglG family transcription antiterminator [Enterococcus raffinosus]
MIDSQDLEILHEIAFRNQRDTAELESKFLLTRRQITYSIKKINDLLSDSEELIKVSGNELRINGQAEKHLQNYLLKMEFFSDVYHSKENRRLMILLTLSCSLEYLSIDHLILMLDSSRSTVVGDLKEVKQQLRRNDINVEYTRVRGYYLSGDEANIRYMVMKTIITFLHQDNGELFLESYLKKQFSIDYSKFESKILAASKQHQISFFENKFKEFTYCFILLIQRFKQKGFQRINSDFIDKQSNEYQFSLDICEYFDIERIENIYYIAAWILGLSTGNIHSATSDRSMIKKIVQRLIARFESLSGIRFLDREAVTRRLYEHFRPTYYRLFYHLPIINPLTPKIKKEYSETYALVNEAIRPLQPLFKRDLPADEIAFLTVHFAAAAFEEQEEQVKRNRGLILCPNGIGTSIILQKELESLFPSIEFFVQDYHKELQTDHFDIVFTTTITPNILSINIPFIVVNPIMTAKEKFELIGRVYGLLNDESLLDPMLADALKVVKKYVTSEQYEKIENELLILADTNHSKIVIEEGGEYPLLSEITNKNLVKLQVEAADWEEAIRNSTDVLVSTGVAEPSYIDGMIQTTKETGPYIVITKHVALPHARPESGAKKIGISIATLKTPVVFGNKENDPVKYIFGLSALDNQTHLTAMSELAELLDQKAFYQILDNAEKPEEVIDFITNFEKERMQK